ncbi:MAG TPA: NTP transferase domain-containing protein [Micromonosporaceae bacterium]|nr:NTP transferase domain-containing protein [Micromonosporaceae bacterium]
MTRPPVCGVVFAAGEGRRLRPLTLLRPKALCPVGNVPLLDRALARMAALGLVGPDRVAVNASYLAEQVVAHGEGRAHLSLEPDGPLGTAGGIGRLRDWIGGRGVLAGNADAYLAPASRASDRGPDAGLAELLADWDGETVRLLGRPAKPGTPSEFGSYRFAGFSLLPWRLVRELRPEPSELVRAVWRPAEAAGALTVVGYRGRYLDTGTPADYLRANLYAVGSGPSLVAMDATVTGALDRAVVGAGATVEGSVTRGVVWPGGHVGRGERLVDAVRAGWDVTMPAGAPLA